MYTLSVATVPENLTGLLSILCLPLSLTPEEGASGCGLFYKPNPGLGDGFIWVFPVDNLYAVTIYDIVFKEDVWFGYVGQKEMHEQSVHKNVPLCSVSISLTPEFYDSYLAERYSPAFRKLPEKAKDLLLNSDWDVGKIAGTVGYKLHNTIPQDLAGLYP